MRETAFIAFGSNQGDRLDYCSRAITLLTLLPHSTVTAISSWYETEPVEDGRHPGPEWFLNGVVRVDTDITPRSLLQILQEIESALGRDADDRGGPRTIDLDLLFYGTRVLDERDLTIPHPRLHERRFVLAPLAELAPEWIHPRLNLTVADLLARLPAQPTVRLLSPQPSRSHWLPDGVPTCSTGPRTGTAP
ncbi:MAG: 2-amino-4-hydroxy-6-hydroxymethyldihydropteridine diphosphokinase [Nitrospiraceae bacterium]